MKFQWMICNVIFIVVTVTRLDAAVAAQSKVRGLGINVNSRKTERRALKMSKADSDCQRRNFKGKKNMFDELQDCIFVGTGTLSNSYNDAEIGKGKGKMKGESKGGKKSKSGNDSNVPTYAPTFVQENVASTAPASVASTMPTNSTTPAPTISPIGITSPQPTTIDNLFRSPTNASSTPPSVGPSNSNQTGLPAVVCLPESNGDFGKETSTTTPHEVSFVYEIEVFPNVNADVVNNQILAQVENRAIRALIPALFSAQCGGTRRLQEGVQAMKASPADKVINGIKCTGNRINEANNCFVVDGKMTLVMGDGDLDENVATSKSTIRATMDGGDFNRLDPRVAGVTYRSDTTIQTDIALPKESPEGGSVASKIPVFGWILIGFGSFMLAVLLCCCFRSRDSRKHGVDDYPGTESRSQQVDPLVQDRSSDYFPSPGGAAMSSAQIYNSQSNARPPPSICRTPSMSSSTNDTNQKPRTGQVNNAGHSDSSQEKKPTIQRAVFPGAQYPGPLTQWEPAPPVKQVQREELLAASSN